MKKLAALLTAAVVFACSFASSVFAEPSPDPGIDTSASSDQNTSPSSPDLGFEVNSEAVYLVSYDSGTVLYQKNADKKMYPASLTKIMTAIIAIENCSDLETVVTAPSYIFDDLFQLNVSNADIRHGEEIRMIDLLYALMLRSACEGASIIADYVGGGSIDNFVQMMNEKAKALGCTNTNFTNPHGLHDDNQYTTAADMYKITKYALDNLPIFKEIACSNSYVMPATNKHSSERTIYHTNTMMDERRAGKYYYAPIKGIKTGTTDESGRNLVSMASQDAYTYILVTMGAPMYYDNGDTISDNLSFIDAKQLYQWAFDKWSIQPVVKPTSPEGEVKVRLAKDKDVVQVFPEKEIQKLLRKDIDISSLQKIKTLEESVDAPVKKGDVLGSMEVKLADETLATVNLVAGEDLDRSIWLFILDCIKKVFTSIWFKLAVVIIIILIALYIAYTVMYNKRKRRRKRRARRF